LIKCCFCSRYPQVYAQSWFIAYNYAPSAGIKQAESSSNSDFDLETPLSVTFVQFVEIGCKAAFRKQASDKVAKVDDKVAQGSQNENC